MQRKAAADVPRTPPETGADLARVCAAMEGGITKNALDRFAFSAKQSGAYLRQLKNLKI